MCNINECLYFFTISNLCRSAEKVHNIFAQKINNNLCTLTFYKFL